MKVFNNVKKDNLTYIDITPIKKTIEMLPIDQRYDLLKMSILVKYYYDTTGNVALLSGVVIEDRYEDNEIDPFRRITALAIDFNLKFQDLDKIITIKEKASLVMIGSESAYDILMSLPHLTAEEFFTVTPDNPDVS